MSTSVLYHAFGVRGYRYVSTGYVEGRTLFQIEQPREDLRCPACGSAAVTAKGQVPRTFLAVPIGRRATQIQLDVSRVHCPACEITRQVEVGFAAPHKRYTKQFARYALELTDMSTIQDVARHLGVSWDLIKDLKKEDLDKRFKKPRLRKLKHIAIDEICIGHGHEYLTIVLDLHTGAIVYVGEGKGAEALDLFWRRLSAARADVRAVAVDMSPAFTKAIRENLPEATVVYDHFHIVKLFNEKLSGLRRDMHRQLTDDLQKQALKGVRWLLLKNPENLDDDQGEGRRLQEALELNAPLATAYYLKEDLRQLWAQGGKREAGKFLTCWIKKAEASGIKMLIQFARTLAIHRAGILAWYDHQISTGPLEGTNNKIRTLTRLAYGYRDREFFILRLHALHETTFKLVG
jgi:transposase